MAQAAKATAKTIAIVNDFIFKTDEFNNFIVFVIKKC